MLTPKYVSLTYDDASLALAVETDGAAVGFDPVTCAEKFRIDDASGFVSVYDGLLQVYDVDAVRLYDYEGNLIHTAPAGASYAAGLNGQYILTDGPWGAGVLPPVERRRHVERTGLAISVPAFCRGGTAYYGIMRFDASAEYSETLNEETYTWDTDSVRYGVVNGAGETVLEAEYEELYAISDGRLFVRRGGARA